MALIRILNRKTLSEKKYLLQNITFEIKDSSGKLHTQQREVYFRPQGATLLLYNPVKRTVLLSRQFRLPAYLIDQEKDLIETCAGMIDEGETPKEAIIREAEEELGYRVAFVSKVCEAYPSPGGLSELIHFYIAPYSDDMKVNAGGGKKDEEEDIDVLELSFVQVRDMLEKGEFTDAKTIILIQYAIIKGLI
ncbi:MAG TPA: NUDIX domain-containing protein [Sphingobacteriaceae bacterium]|nr:NUDIX domain-containing protein [Sphingobacteriaceae bacterium]